MTTNHVIAWIGRAATPARNKPRMPAIALCVALWFLMTGPLQGASLDVAPFGLALPEGAGVMWEDPREIHRVVVHFAGRAPAPESVRLQYWGSRWPQQRLPKDKEPGGGDVGWLELGNWHTYGWRTADAEAKAEGAALVFTFRPVNAKEFPKAGDYRATFRYTLKIRLAADTPLPEITRLEAFTDSMLAERSARLAWKTPPPTAPACEVYNGRLIQVAQPEPASTRLDLQVAANSDPNTFDRTLVTVRQGQSVFTFKYDDLAQGPLFLPHLGVAVLAGGDPRTYEAIAEAQKARVGKSLYDRIAALPEQTWKSAWEGVPRKRSSIYFPLGLDGGRQRFRLNANGSIEFRSNDGYLQHRPGKDTPRLALEKAPVQVRFGLPDQPVHRTLEEACLPICETTWEVNGVRVRQTAFVTALEGTDPKAGTPPADTFTVWMARFTMTNPTGTPKPATLPVAFGGAPAFEKLRVSADGLIWNGDLLRAQAVAEESAPAVEPGKLTWSWTLSPGQTRTLVLKIPYVVLNEPAEHESLRRLNFELERKAAADYWRQRLDQSARLVTPEPMLNEFYRSHAMHLLVNCEREPGSDRRFARVGSFGYGAYGNESCMMVADLERRGFHQEAQDCLDAWLHYQGTAGLPGDFSTREGVLYGAGGYEAGGYNQHHGWILWMLGEHYRFTRDAAWLRGAAPGVVKACDWIIGQVQRTAHRQPLERGLLPAGSLEDIGDWWTWLSTSCYTWRGLDSAAGALEQIHHPEAGRIRLAADAFHTALTNNFSLAAARSPVVRLGDGTAAPHFPSYAQRRGRSFGWICETLEGALHLLITGAIDPASQQATWILKDYEDNLYLSNQYGYLLDDFDRHWFGRGGMSMQACLLLDVEPYLYRDDVKHALRALFNGQAVSYFPDVRMNTEHALPHMEDWRGDHFKSSDESNTAGWLRYLFVREQGDTLLIGQAAPREWLGPGLQCGIERTATWFGTTSILYTGDDNQITAKLDAPRRNAPQEIRLRFRDPQSRPLSAVMVDGKPWSQFEAEWVRLPGNLGSVTVVGSFKP